MSLPYLYYHLDATISILLINGQRQRLSIKTEKDVEVVDEMNKAGGSYFVLKQTQNAQQQQQQSHNNTTTKLHKMQAVIGWHYTSIANIMSVAPHTENMG